MRAKILSCSFLYHQCLSERRACNGNDRWLIMYIRFLNVDKHLEYIVHSKPAIPSQTHCDSWLINWYLHSVFHSFYVCTFFSFLGQGSNWSCSLLHSHSNTRTLTHWARQGIKPASLHRQCCEPLSHNRNSIFSFLYLYYCG